MTVGAFGIRKLDSAREILSQRHRIGPGIAEYVKGMNKPVIVESVHCLRVVAHLNSRMSDKKNRQSDLHINNERYGGIYVEHEGLAVIV